MLDPGAYIRAKRQNIIICFTTSCGRHFSKKYKEVPIGTEKRNVIARILLV